MLLTVRIKDFKIKKKKNKFKGNQKKKINCDVGEDS